MRYGVDPPGSGPERARSGIRVTEPAACRDPERQEFERLVRLGFEGSDAGLPDRVRAAHRLAFGHGADGSVTAVAGLKKPPDQYRAAVFSSAATALDADDYPLELGWVFVLPSHRGRRLGIRLCERLLESAPRDGVYALTKPHNRTMHEILRRLDFARVGKPYPRRDHELALFVRPGRLAPD